MGKMKEFFHDEIIEQLRDNVVDESDCDSKLFWKIGDYSLCIDPVQKTVLLIRDTAGSPIIQRFQNEREFETIMKFEHTNISRQDFANHFEKVAKNLQTF